MSESSSPAAQPDAPGAALDRLDDDLLVLALKRLAASEALTRATPLVLPGPRPLPLHPARDVRLLRRLVAGRDESEADLVVDLWRVLIGAEMRRAGPVDVVVGGAADLLRLHDIARRHYGPRTRIHRASDVRAALARAVETELTVLVLPWPGKFGAGTWWPHLNESKHHKLALIAGLPLRGARDADPEVAVFAQNAPLEAAGDDVTMAIAHDPRYSADKYLAEAGFTGREVARSGETVLLRMDGFFAGDDPRVAGLGRGNLGGLRVIGSYARI